jgi:hypothetical protein
MGCILCYIHHHVHVEKIIEIVCDSKMDGCPMIRPLSISKRGSNRHIWFEVSEKSPKTETRMDRNQPIQSFSLNFIFSKTVHWTTLLYLVLTRKCLINFIHQCIDTYLVYMYIPGTLDNANKDRYLVGYTIYA